MCRLTLRIWNKNYYVLDALWTRCRRTISSDNTFALTCWAVRRLTISFNWCRPKNDDEKKKITTILIICVWYGRKTKGTTTTTTTTEKQQKLCDKWNLYLNWTAARQETTNKFDKIKCLEDFARLNTIITIKRAVVIDTAFSSNDSKAINAVRTFCPPGQPRTWSFYD